MRNVSFGFSSLDRRKIFFNQCADGFLIGLISVFHGDIEIDDLLERGFRTKNGSIRTPQSIQSYATLATIIFQTNQNEQHGGQAIPAFDFFMAKGVAISFRKHLASFINFYVAT